MENNSLDRLLEVERTARELAAGAEREAESRIKALALRKQDEYDRAVENYQRKLQAGLEGELAAAERKKVQELESFERKLASIPSTEIEFKAKVHELIAKGEL